MSEPQTSNPLSEMGSNLFVRRYQDGRGVWHEERQVNLGGQQGTVTYVHVNDYDKALTEIERLTAERDQLFEQKLTREVAFADLRAARDRMKTALVSVRECISHQDFMRVRRIVDAALEGAAVETRGVPPREFELESHQGLYTERAAAETKGSP